MRHSTGMRSPYMTTVQGQRCMLGMGPGSGTDTHGRSSAAAWVDTVLTPGVYALQVFDDGTGPKLAVGGVFDWVGDHYPANSIAAWDGTAWSRVGTGFDWDVYALTVFDDGSGPALYAGGTFLHAGNVPAQHVCKVGRDGVERPRRGSGR